MKRASYANVISTLALSLALGMGSAYAIERLPERSVGAKQLRPGAVTAKKLRKNAVTAPKIEALAVKQGKIANGAITAAKISPGAVDASKLPAGVIGTEKLTENAVTGAKLDESSLSRVPAAERAETAVTATTANPEAFARVNAEGTVFPAASKEIGTADVKQGTAYPGIYCIAVPFAARGAQVTPEYAGHHQVAAYVRLGGTEHCPAPQAEVQTYNAGNPSKEPFYVVFYR